jgi:site-specific DNA-methyltransferase (adenine-specific)
MAESLIDRLYKNGIKNPDAEHSPDVLSCLANLSNDEVFTPPEVVNRMLDLLPQELFSDPNTKFLDPACKTGVFLREIAKRLLIGLEPIYPDLQERIDHIFHNQLYGIAITELTSLLSRRSVYCSQYPNGQYSVSRFDSSEGNIRFKKIQHTWEAGKCKYCGASRSEYDRSSDKETYAYEFIHMINIEEALKMAFFDVVISNPPYQLSDGGTGGSATPIYHKFIENAKKLNPRFLTMIVPSRWYSGGRGLDEFRNSMLKDKHIKELHDFTDPGDCFPGVSIKGGVCYFLWDKAYDGDCLVSEHSGNSIISTEQRPLLEDGANSFIRFNKGVNIYHKVKSFGEKTFDSIVSSSKPFGMRTFVQGNKRKSTGDITLYGNKSITYIPKKDVEMNKAWVDKNKVLITYAYGAGEGFPHQIINKPFAVGPGTACTETYLVIGPFDTAGEADNVVSYMNTKFFRFMVLLLKSTQHATQGVYKFVPMQDFSKSWTDEELYEKYNLTTDEISFIESMIKPME